MSVEVPIIILTLGIFIFFISRWILRKYNLFSPDWRNEISVGFAIVLSPITYILIIFIWIFSATYYPEYDFDKTKWRKYPEERFHMTADLIESDLLIGKTRSEVIELLGDEYYSFRDGTIQYDVGFVPGLFNIDPEVLSIEFQHDRVIRVTQYET